MARKLRVQYSGAIYHVMNRGDRREAIFLSDKDRVLFVDTLAEACEKTDWQVLGPEEPLQSYPWSSYPLHLQEPTRRPVWLRVGHP
jgi:hypothetical protein